MWAQIKCPSEMLVSWFPCIPYTGIELRGAWSFWGGHVCNACMRGEKNWWSNANFWFVNFLSYTSTNTKETSVGNFFRTVIPNNYPIYQLKSHQNFFIVSTGCTIHLLPNFWLAVNEIVLWQESNWWITKLVHAGCLARNHMGVVELIHSRCSD